MKVVTARQMRAIEEVAIHSYGIPALLLMENAARGVVKHVIETVRTVANPKVFVVAGTGNNGGDGFAAARLLFAREIDVCVLVVGNTERLTPDARLNLDMALSLGIPVAAITPEDFGNLSPEIIEDIRRSDVVLDSLFGTGLSKAPEGCYAEVIHAVNHHAKHVIAVDIPSGVCADDGHVPGAAVRADQTITFGFAKLGLLLYPGAEYAGTIVIENISIPAFAALEAGVKSDALTDAEAAALLPVRPPRTNKGTFGKAYVLAGCAEMSGAAVLAAHAAYRAGAGLVAAGVVAEVARVIQGSLPEAVTRILPNQDGSLCRAAYEAIAPDLNSATVITVGPGIGRSPQAAEFVTELLWHASAPLVLDADALFAIAVDPSILSSLSVPCIITPHPGEMSRLTGYSIEEIINDTVGVALTFAKEYGVITILKDARTIIAAPDGRFAVNTTGNSAMAKAGSGDVLTGIITGLMAQGMEAYDASVLGVYVHGKAGDSAAKSLSGYSVNATDLIAHLSPVLSALSRWEAKK